MPITTSLVPVKVMIRPEKREIFDALNQCVKSNAIFELISKRTQTFAGGNNSIDFITLKDPVTNRVVKDVFADDVFMVLA